MRKYLLISVAMILGLMLVSCGGTSDNNDTSSSSNSKKSLGGSSIYFMTSSEDENVVKANWVSGASNEDALQAEEVKPAPKKKVATKKAETKTETNNDTTNNTASTATTINRTNNAVKTPTVQNNTTANKQSTNPTISYPKDSSADANTIVADPYDESSNTEEVDDKKVTTESEETN